MARQRPPLTERDWLGRASIERMLEHVAGTVSERKLRLFVSACCRRIDPARHRDVFDLAEAYADGHATAHQLAAARFAGRFQPGHPAWAVAWEPGLPPLHAVQRALWWAAGQGGWREPSSREADLLREVVGNPFRPVRLDPAWLAASDGAAVGLARTIYAERRFADLPFLGDALEEAGCTDEAVLAHCRQGGEHVRGCWLVDLVLRRS
jgi:hypothetical protein